MPDAPLAGYVPFLSSPALILYAEILEDMEAVRISHENRLRSFVREDDAAWMPPGVCDPADNGVTSALIKVVSTEVAAARAEERRPRVAPGWGREVWDLCLLILSVESAEHEAELTLKRSMRGHPLAQWASTIPGAGEKQFGRLLGTTGDPYVRDAEEREHGLVHPPWPRTLSQWRSYCGHGDPSRRPFKGMSQDDARALGNPAAKMRAHLIAESIIKAQVRKVRGGDDGDTARDSDDGDGYDVDGRVALGHLGQVYLDARRAYADRVHAGKCVRCGPSGHPALPGSPWSPKHQNAAAQRLVAKTFLDDLWREAKRLHEEAGR